MLIDQTSPPLRNGDDVGAADAPAEIRRRRGGDDDDAMEGEEGETMAVAWTDELVVVFIVCGGESRRRRCHQQVTKSADFLSSASSTPEIASFAVFLSPLSAIVRKSGTFYKLSSSPPILVILGRSARGYCRSRIQ